MITFDQLPQKVDFFIRMIRAEKPINEKYLLKQEVSCRNR